MPKIIPAILTDDPVDLEKKMAVAEKLSDEVHIDLMDGDFVETVSVPAQTVAELKTSADLEAHLMVRHPEAFMAPFRDSKVKRIIFHAEAVDNVEFLIRLIKDQGFSVELAINPATPLDAVVEHLSEVDLVHFLAVNPGRQGNQFQPQVIKKIRSLSDLWSSGTISVDGGVGAQNLFDVVAAGADRIICGSYLWKSDDPIKTFNTLKQMV